jgi:hypothetical protein
MTSRYYSFAKDAAERAAKTFVQTLAAVWTADGVFNILEVDWQASLGAAVSAAVLSFVMSLASKPVGDSGTASAVDLGLDSVPKE